MRFRDLKVNGWVEVNDAAPGSLAGFRGRRGTISALVGGSTAEVAFSDTKQIFMPRFLTAVDGPPPPPDSVELAAFKDQVATVALRYAREHNLCEVINDALKELGITPKPRGAIRIVLEIPEDEFDDYVEQGSDVLADIAENIKDLFHNAYESDYEEWLKTAEYVEAAKEGPRDH